jgi:hypothetical protein
LPQTIQSISSHVKGSVAHRKTIAEPAANVEGEGMKAAQKSISNHVFIKSIKEIPDGTNNIGPTINYRSNRRTLIDSKIQVAFNAIQSEVENTYEIRKQP